MDDVQVHPLDRRKAAWLYAQFTVSKTVSLKKSHVGLTIIRNSDINDKSFTERAPKLGGLVEFYRSPDRVLWTPTGINVPDYPKLAQLWWQQIGDVNSGAFTPEQAMNRLARKWIRSWPECRQPTKRPRPTAAAGHASTQERIRKNGWVSRMAQRRSSRTRSPRAKRSPMTN